MARKASCAFIALFLAATVQAGQGAAPGAVAAAPAVALPVAFDGPPPPVPPEVITRDGAGRATVRAVLLTAPLRIDGKLDEVVYENVPPISDFIQQEPVENVPAAEKTDVWVFFDRNDIYLVGRCWDSRPDRMIAREMRRDSIKIPQNENFTVSLDTFYDRRNGYAFEVTPLGGKMDMEMTAEGQTYNLDWNPVWETATSPFEHGWVVEMRIPFKSLRYGPGTAQVWGLQVRRIVRWKNEVSFLTRVPAAIGERGHAHLSLAATLVGLEVPPAARNLEIKPYVISSLSSDATANPRTSNDLTGNWGGDIKYAVTKGLTADLTYNTDFAQVEADLQQVNLTRFSLFFPEKRDFFLENSGMFTFGGASGRDNTPALFYSRRIGLSGSQSVPIVAGGRVSGRVGKFSVGVLDIVSDAVPASGVAATNFSVVRVKRDILRRSYIGALFTSRSVGQNSVGTNQAYGLDGTFILTNTATFNTFWAKTRSPGRSTADTSYRAQFDYAGDRYGVQVERLVVGANFNPEVGFVRRLDIQRSYGLFRFSPRPRASNKLVRRFFYNGTTEYIENAEGRRDWRSGTLEFAVDLQNGDRYNVKYADVYEWIPAPLRLASNVVVPVGGYDYRSVVTGYNFGPQRKSAVANVSLEYGTFYSGHKTTLTVTNGLVSFPPHVLIEPTYSFNRVNLTQGAFTTHLLGPRLTGAVTPQMFLSALVQYNSSANTLSTNVRFRWEFQPGSEFFAVWNEQRSTSASAIHALQNRALIMKINRLFRF